MTAIQYIQSKAFKHKIQSGQIVLKTCPFCGDSKSHFYMEQENGAFFCHKCNEAGNLITLKKHFGDYEYTRQRSGNMNKGRTDTIKQAFPEEGRGKVVTLNAERAVRAHERLLNDPEAMQYVSETRGLSNKAVIHWKLGLEIKEGTKWLTIPHYQKNRLVNIKFRSLPPAEKTFRRVEGCPSIMFNGDILHDKPDTVYLCEGELDTLALWDKGENKVVGTTTGAGSFAPSWMDQLVDVKKLIIVYDSDEPGQKGAREIARRLGYDRCYNVTLPEGQDVNDFFRAGHSIADFVSYVAKYARRFDVSGVTSFMDCLDRFQNRSQDIEKGLLTKIHSIDRNNKRGMRSGELIIYASPPGIGKTSIVLQIISNKALERIPALFFSMEMGINDLTEKIIQSHTRTENIGIMEIERTRSYYTGKPLYFGRCYQKPTLEGIIATLKEAIRLYGLKLIAFDHLHFLIRSIANQTQEVSLAVQAFKLLAEEMEIPIILIAQPRKTDLTKPMTAADLKDSSSIHSDADYILILHRNRKASHKIKAEMEIQDQSLDPITLVRFEKARYGRGGECLLYFHGEYSRFDEIER